MSALMKGISRVFSSEIKVVFNDHSMHAYINGELVPTELLFDIDAASADRGGFTARFTKEYRRLCSVHLRWVLAKPLLILELKGESAYRKDFRDLLTGIVGKADDFRQVRFQINDKLTDG